MICSIEGCDRQHHARGWCSMHWARWFRHGDPLIVLPRGQSPGEVRARFWFHVNHTATCWLWTSTTRNGYGRFLLAGHSITAHRYAYELLVGPIPDGLTLDHLCRNRACVNPVHLEPVTHRENTRRSPIATASLNAAKTHCHQGHEFSIANTYHRRKRAGRECRICAARLARNRRVRLTAIRERAA